MIQLYIYSYLGFFTEKGMATHFSTLACKIPWTEEPVGCSPWGHEELDTTERLHSPFSRSCIGEGNGNPLQCSCLENPRDREPGGLLSMGSPRVRHNWSDLAVLFWFWSIIDWYEIFITVPLLLLSLLLAHPYNGLEPGCPGIPLSGSLPAPVLTKNGLSATFRFL